MTLQELVEKLKEHKKPAPNYASLAEFMAKVREEMEKNKK